MNKYNIKSIVLGIGIGIIFTSVLSLIYFAGFGQNENISKNEIIRRAEGYGMVKGPDFFHSETATE